MLTIGTNAPTFHATNTSGEVRSLIDFRGTWLILYFYPKDDTPGCTIEACGFRDAFGELSQRAVVLGVSKDSKESHEKFITKYSLPFELLIDADGILAKAYGAIEGEYGKRVTFLIDPNGMLQKIYQGFDCKEHAKSILKDLEQLQA